VDGVCLPDGPPPDDDDSGVDDDDSSSQDDDDSGVSEDDDDLAPDDDDQAPDVVPAGCPPLPPSAGSQVVIPSGDFGALRAAVEGASPGDVILLEDGTYLPGGYQLQLEAEGLVLRSLSGDRDAVVLDGAWSTDEIVRILGGGITVADLTIRRANAHPIHAYPGVGSDTTGTLIYNVRIEDAGEQAIKVNPYYDDYFTDQGTVACSHIEQTDEGRPHIASGCYTNGIDLVAVRGWHLRDNHIEGFWCPDSRAGPAILVWRSSADILIERNVLVDNARAISLGMAEDGGTRSHPDIDCGGTDFDVYRGTVRNNTVLGTDPDLLASVDGIADGINAWNVCEAELLHNTVYFSSGVFSAMEYRFPNTTAWVANNLLSHSLEQREEAQGTVHDNIESADAGHFEDVAGGNLHLSVSSSAIDAGGSLAAGACDEDIDGDLRDADPDVGADEQVSEER